MAFQNTQRALTAFLIGIFGIAAVRPLPAGETRVTTAQEFRNAVTASGTGTVVVADGAGIDLTAGFTNPPGQTRIVGADPGDGNPPTSTIRVADGIALFTYGENAPGTFAGLADLNITRAGGPAAAAGTGAGTINLKGAFTGGIDNVVVTGHSSAGNGGFLTATSFTDGITDSTFSGNASANWGGAIYIGGSFAGGITNSVFDGNVSTTGSAGFHAYVYPGTDAAFVGDVQNSTFSNNSSGANVGGAFGLNNVKLKGNVLDSKFINNTNAHTTSTFGGGASVDELYGRIDNCLFEGNSAVSQRSKNGSGGGLYAVHVQDGIFNSTFTGNTAYLGGAVYIGNKAFAGNIENTDFIENHALSQGGALYIGGKSGDVMSMDGAIINSRFIRNVADAGGGAIILMRLKGGIQDSLFLGNSGPIGGAIAHAASSAGYYGDIEGGIVNSRFIGNQAVTTGSVISTSRDVLADIVDSRFEDNAVTNGGATLRINRYYRGNISGTVFRDNSAGGVGYGGAGILAKEGFYGNITDSQFESNTGGSDYGGAVSVQAGNFEGNIADSAFSGNIVGLSSKGDNQNTRGGALGISGTIVGTVKNTVFSQNSAMGLESRGGAISATGITGSVSGGMFSRNRAGYGGAIHLLNGMTGANGADGVIADTVFDQNIANRDGGTVAFQTGAMTFRDATFTGNAAAGNGGAIHAGGALTLAVSDAKTSLFVGNRDGSGANSVYLAAGSLTADVAGSGVLDMRDALRGSAASGKTLTVQKTGDGAWHLCGASAFASAGGSTRFTHSAGSLYLYHASGQAGGVAARAGADDGFSTGRLDLEGSGSSFTMADGARLRVGGGNAITITSSAANPAGAGKQGTMTFNSGAFDFDLGNAVDSAPGNYKNPMLTLAANRIDFNETITVNLTSVPNKGGYYVLVRKDANSGTAFSLNGNVSSTVTYRGRAITSERFREAYQVDVPDGDTIVLSPGYVYNKNIEWNATADAWVLNENLWNDIDEPVATNTSFLPGDAVLFTAAVPAAAHVDEEMQVSSLTVTGGSHSFTGEAIVSADSVVNKGGSTTTPVNLTKKATVKSGGGATFANRIDFENGLEIETGGAVTVKDGGSLADRMAVTVDGELTFDVANNATYAQAGALSGAGTVRKENLGTLTLSDAENFQGTFRQDNGVVELNSNIGSAYEQHAGTLYTRNDVTIERDVLLSGTVSPGKRKSVADLYIGGNLTLTNATLEVDVTNFTHDTIHVDGQVTFDDASAVSIVLGEWKADEYEILKGASVTRSNLYDIPTGGTDPNGRRSAKTFIRDDTVILKLENENNRNLVWTGADADYGDRWFCRATNWRTFDNDEKVTQFLDGDAVIFDKIDKDIHVCKPGNVYVASILVRNGATVSFFNRDEVSTIVSTSGDTVQQHTGDEITVSKDLRVTGEGSSAHFKTAVDLAGGLKAYNGGEMRFSSLVTSKTGIILGSAGRAVLLDDGEIAEGTGVVFNPGLVSDPGDTIGMDLSPTVANVAFVDSDATADPALRADSTAGVFSVNRTEDYRWSHSLTGPGILRNDGDGILWFTDNLSWSGGTILTDNRRLGIGFADDAAAPATIDVGRFEVGAEGGVVFQARYAGPTENLAAPLLTADDIVLAGQVKATITDLSHITAGTDAVSETRRTTVAQARNALDLMDSAVLSGDRALYHYLFEVNPDNPNHLDLVISPITANVPDAMNSFLASTNSRNTMDALFRETPTPGGELEAHWQEILNAENGAHLNRLVREINGTQLAGSAAMTANAASRLPGWLRKNPLGYNGILDSLQDQVSNPDALAAPILPYTGESPWRFLAGAIGERTRLRGSDGEPGYRVNTWGGAIAMDRMIGGAAPGNGWRVGAAMEADWSKLRWTENGDSADADTVSWAVYAKAEAGRWFASAMADFGITHTKSQRNLPTSGLAATAKYTSRWYGGALQGGYAMDLRHNFRVVLNGGLTYSHNAIPAVDEHGAGTLSQHLDRSSTDNLNLNLSVELSRLYRTGFCRLPLAWSPWLRVGVNAETWDQGGGITTRFIGEPDIPSFISHMPDTGRVGVEVGAGIRAALTRRLELALEYAGDFRSNQTRHAGLLSMEVRF